MVLFLFIGVSFDSVPSFYINKPNLIFDVELAVQFFLFGVRNFIGGISSNSSCLSASSVVITVLVEGDWLSFEGV